MIKIEDGVERVTYELKTSPNSTFTFRKPLSFGTLPSATSYMRS